MEKSESNPSRESGKKFSEESIADKLGIAKENLENRTVRNFVDVVNATENLQSVLSRLVHDRGSVTLDTVDPGGWSTRPLNESTLTPNLATRYARAELLMRAAYQILTDGIGGQGDVSANYLGSKITNALAPYGLKVAPLGEGVDVPSKKMPPHN